MTRPEVRARILDRAVPFELLEEFWEWVREKGYEPTNRNDVFGLDYFWYRCPGGDPCSSDLESRLPGPMFDALGPSLEPILYPGLDTADTISEVRRVERNYFKISSPRPGRKFVRAGYKTREDAYLALLEAWLLTRDTPCPTSLPCGTT